MQQESSEEVLRQLIDARLLTSYEMQEDDEAPTRRVEIIHESLLANWPRLVRWQTQDQEGAQLRDELRQAARSWDEHGRHDDRLWTGTAFTEFELWRGRYTGGLTEIEDAFVAAMTSLATRRKRRRHLVTAAAFIVLLAVLAVVVVSRQQAVSQARRAEAQKLIALGKARLEKYPTEALAHATQSLELADSEEARFLALEALWQGPTAFIVNEEPTRGSSFSPGGSWLVQSHHNTSSLTVISRDGLQRVLDHPTDTGGTTVFARFGGRDNEFVSHISGRVALWSAPDAQLLATAHIVDDPEGHVLNHSGIGGESAALRGMFVMPEGNLVRAVVLYPDGRNGLLGTIEIEEGGRSCIPWATAEWFGLVEGNDVSIVRIGESGISDRILLGRHRGELLSFCDPDPRGRFLVTLNRAGEIRLWGVNGEQASVQVGDLQGWCRSWLSDDGSHFWTMAFPPGQTAANVWIWGVDDLSFQLRRRVDGVPGGPMKFDPVGLWLAIVGPEPAYSLWSLRAPAAADPIILRFGPAWSHSTPSFTPDGKWLTTSDMSGLTFWPLVGPHPAVIHPATTNLVGGVSFGQEGRFLLAAVDTTLLLYPLEGHIPPVGRTVFEAEAERDMLIDVAVSPDGKLFAAATNRGRAWIGKIDGGEIRRLPGTCAGFPTFSPDGRFVAARCTADDLLEPLRVWDVTTAQEIATLMVADDKFRLGANLTSDGYLITGTPDGVIAWDIDTGEQEILVEVDALAVVASDDGRRLLLTEAQEGGANEEPAGGPLFFDLDTGAATELSQHGSQVWVHALDRDGVVAVTGDRNGIIRVGPVTGGEPHLLLGHEGDINYLAIDPRNRWIASVAQDDTIRLWPMPDLDKPPLHTLPREELIAKLKSLTNVRVVRDEDSATGWKLTHDPFPGWEVVPTW
jgi:WD40 repeat protein